MTKNRHSNAVNLVAASAAQLAQLLAAEDIHHLAALREWAGPNIRPPNDLNDLFGQIQLHQQPSYCLIQDGEVVAFGQRLRRWQRHHLGRLLVARGQRGQRIGQQLVQALIVNAQQQERAGVSLFVYKHNTAAIRCYQHCGFEIMPMPESLGAAFDAMYFMLHPDYEL